MVKDIDLEQCNFRNFRSPRYLDFDLWSGRCQTGAHIRTRSTYTPNYIEIEKKNFCWRTDGRTYRSVRTDTPEFSKSIRPSSSPVDDLKIKCESALKTAFMINLKIGYPVYRRLESWHINELECGRMPNVMAALPNIGGELFNAEKFGWRPLLDAVQ